MLEGSSEAYLEPIRASTMVLRKWLAAESRYLFSQKRSIVNIRLDSKHIPAIC